MRPVLLIATLSAVFGLIDCSSGAPPTRRPAPAAAAAMAPAAVSQIPIPAPPGASPSAATMFLDPLEMTYGLPLSASAKFVAPIANPPSPAATGGKVHLVLIGHSRDSSIGSGVVVTAQKIEEMFLAPGVFDPLELTVYTIGLPPGVGVPGIGRKTYHQLSTNQIDTAINQMNIASGDAIFCYVMCHGAYDGNHRSAQYEYGHWFQMETGSSSYPRVNLMEKLLSKRARLTVLVSDSCNVRVDITSPASAPATALLTAIRTFALRNLLMNSTGQVSISATSEGEFSFYYPDKGGFFSDAFIETMKWMPDDTEWPQFFSTLESEVHSAFYRAFPDGYPYAFINGRPVRVTNPAQFQKTFTPKAMRSLTLVTGSATTSPTPTITKNPLGFPKIDETKLKQLSATQMQKLEELKNSSDASQLTALVKQFNQGMTKEQRQKRAMKLKEAIQTGKKGEAAQRFALVEAGVAAGTIDGLIDIWKQELPLIKKLRAAVNSL